jgi:DNA-binding NarL/FixJ family response regulator
VVKKARKPALQRTRILIVDDHPVVRDGLAAQLALQPDLEVCGEADDVACALELVKSMKPDVAIVDVSLKSGNGIDLIKRIRTHESPVRILVWSMYAEEIYAERALDAGAQGYIHKGRATREIHEALRTILAGNIYLSPDQSNRMLTRMAGGQKQTSAIDELSDRELEVFIAMGQGLKTEMIAKRLRISPKTVETYRVHIKTKLGVANITELIHRAATWIADNS